jgi:hypothetical protein
MKNTIATVAIFTSFCLAERDCRAELLGSFDFGTESTLERGEGEASLSIDDSGKWEKSSENSGFLTVNGTVPTRAVSLTCPPNFINAASFLLQFSFKVDSQAEGQFSTYTYLISSDHFYLRLNADATLLTVGVRHINDWVEDSWQSPVPLDEWQKVSAGVMDGKLFVKIDSVAVIEKEVPFDAATGLSTLYLGVCIWEEAPRASQRSVSFDDIVLESPVTPPKGR